MIRHFPIVLLAAGCATTPAPPAAPAPAPAPEPPPVVAEMARHPSLPCPGESPEYARCMARFEAQAMTAAGGRVSRTGDSLVIRGEAGRPLVLEDVTRPEERTVVHRYHAWVPELGQHLVGLGFYEGGGWLLVDGRTTDQTHVLGPPMASPGRTRFAAASVDLVAGYDPNGLQVWRMVDGHPRLEWEILGGDAWGASEAEWRGDDVLEFIRHEPYPEDPGRTLQRRMRLTLAGPGLRLEPAPR